MFDERWGLRDFHHLNEHLAGFLSLITNLLLMNFILTEKNEVLRSYSKVLLQNCIVDFLFTLGCILAELQMEMYDGHYIFVVSGLLSRAPIPYQYAICWYWVFMCAFAIMVIPVMFFYRWRLVCKGVQIPLGNLFLILLIPSGAAAFETSFLTLGQLQNEPHREELCERLLNHTIWNEGDSFTPRYPRNCIAAYAMNRYTLVFVICAMITDTLTYVAIATLGLAILKGLRKSRKDMSSRTARMQKQMNMILAVQAITPLFTATIPVGVMVITLFFKINIRGAGLVIAMVLSWIPIMNPLSTMLFVSAYRRRLIHFCIRCGSMGTVSSTMASSSRVGVSTVATTRRSAATTTLGRSRNNNNNQPDNDDQNIF